MPCSLTVESPWSSVFSLLNEQLILADALPRRSSHPHSLVVSLLVSSDTANGLSPSVMNGPSDCSLAPNPASCSCLDVRLTALIRISPPDGGWRTETESWLNQWHWTLRRCKIYGDLHVPRDGRKANCSNERHPKTRAFVKIVEEEEGRNFKLTRINNC